MGTSMWTTGIILMTFLGSIFTKQPPVTIEEEEGIELFEGTWEEALAKAEKENKLIFLDAYASWCGPCKRMSQDVFTHKKVGQYFNEHFINVKMDMEKGEGRLLSNKLNVQAYPTLFFLSAKEVVADQSIGYKNTSALLQFGKQANE